MDKGSSIKVAVPTDDGINIFQGMLGRAKEIFIYQCGNGMRFKLIEKRNNPYRDTMQHLKTLDVYELFRDCRIVISETIGKKGIKRLQEREMKLFFEKGNIEEALAGLAKKQGSDRLCLER